MLKNWKLYLPLVPLLLLAIWVLYSRKGEPPTPTVLPQGVIAIVKFDESKHALTVVTSKGSKTTFARKPEVRINEDKTTTVFTHSYGAYRKPFLGLGFSNTIRGYFGVSLLYWQRFDVNCSVGITSDRRFNALEPTISIGYLMYSNTSINLGVVPLSYLPGKPPEIAGFVSLKF